jgi:hypothetical protein
MVVIAVWKHTRQILLKIHTTVRGTGNPRTVEVKQSSTEEEAVCCSRRDNAEHEEKGVTQMSLQLWSLFDHRYLTNNLIDNHENRYEVDLPTTAGK